MDLPGLIGLRLTETLGSNDKSSANCLEPRRGIHMFILIRMSFSVCDVRIDQ